VNLERRDLKNGPKAMALAMLFPESEKGGRGKRAQPERCQKVTRSTKCRRTAHLLR
jgi:hypothetical protein